MEFTCAEFKFLENFWTGIYWSPIHMSRVSLSRIYWSSKWNLLQQSLREGNSLVHDLLEHPSWILLSRIYLSIICLSTAQLRSPMCVCLHCCGTLLELGLVNLHGQGIYLSRDLLERESTWAGIYLSGNLLEQGFTWAGIYLSSFPCRTWAAMRRGQNLERKCPRHQTLE